MFIASIYEETIPSDMILALFFDVSKCGAVSPLNYLYNYIYIYIYIVFTKVYILVVPHG